MYTVERSEYQQQRYEKLNLYVDDVILRNRQTSPPEFSEDAIKLGWAYYNGMDSILRSRDKSLLVPNACPGLSGNFMFVWKKDDHYL